MAKPQPNAPASQDGSTPKPQTAATVHADTGTKASDADLKAAHANGPQAPDPLIENAPGRIENTAAVPGETGEKISVRTAGDFNLMDPFTARHIGAGETVTDLPVTQWVTDQLEAKRLIRA